jgi:predicted Holliday junction resolvase-like endonuclease
METLSPQIIAAIVVFALFCVVFLLIGLRAGAVYGRKKEAAEWEAHRLEDVVRSRLRQSRAVIGGLVSEQMAPLLPGFPFDPGDCRFVGKPVDFIVFKGMNEKKISSVIFLEVKSGSERKLNDQEKQLKEAILKGRVKWAEFDAGNYGGRFNDG